MNSDKIFDELSESKKTSQFISVDVDHRQAQLYIPSSREKNKLQNDTTYVSLLKNDILNKLKIIIKKK